MPRRVLGRILDRGLARVRSMVGSAGFPQQAREPGHVLGEGIAEECGGEASRRPSVVKAVAQTGVWCAMSAVRYRRFLSVLARLTGYDPRIWKVIQGFLYVFFVVGLVIAAFALALYLLKIIL